MAEMEDFEFGSVCSGIEAASVAFDPLGWRAAWLAEIEPFPSAVLQHHYPSVPNLGDMTRVAAMVRARRIKAPNMLCGGTPCQSFSLAGLRKSLDDARGNLALEFIRIADAIDDIRRADGKPPAYVLWENVPGVLNTKDNAFGSFLGGLCGSDAALHPDNDGWPSAGVVAGPRRVVAWRVLDAQHFGVAQRRRRVYVLALAGPGGWRCADALLSIRHSLSGHPAPSREAREETAPSLVAGAGRRGGVQGDAGDGGLIPSVVGALPAGHGPNGHGGSGLANLQGAESGHILAFGGNRTSGPIDVAPALLAQPGSGYKNDFESETFLLDPTHTLRGEGFDASEDGTGRGTPLLPVAVDIRNGMLSSNGPTQTLQAAGLGTERGGNPNAMPHVLAFDTTQVTSATNRSNPKPGDPCHALPAHGHPPAIAFPQNLSATQHASAENIAPSMGAKNPTAVATNMRVRRLTPTECERLQGFPDGYTDVPWRGKRATDGPRYKALGNSWAVPTVQWIGRRIEAVEAIR